MANRLTALVNQLSFKMSSESTPELWQSLPLAPPDSIFKLTAAYKVDTYPQKVNLGVGAYRDDSNKPWVLPVVRKASNIIANDESLDHEYLPITGLPSFTEAAARLILGSDSPAIRESRSVSVQTISGTGANHLGAAFLSRFYGWNGAKKVFLSNPTWANHHAIFRNVGIEPVDYPYYNPATIGLDFDGFIGSLESAPARSVFLLHACAHNPTGVDPTREQWTRIAEVMLKKSHYAFFDCAYQGFASGDLDNDAWAVRHFIEKGVAGLVCQSFAKNAGLYGERVGALHVFAPTQETAVKVKSQLSVLQRSEISNPPTYGARIMSLILNDETLFAEWKRDITTMAQRIISMRKELHRILTEELKTPGKWDHIVEQIGMFSFTGLNTEQSMALTEKAHIYLTTNGRISMAGLNSHNIKYFAESLDKVVRGQLDLLVSCVDHLHSADSLNMSFRDKRQAKSRSSSSDDDGPMHSTSFVAPPPSIPLPDPPMFSSFSSDGGQLSPFVHFYTAPSSPMQPLDSPAEPHHSLIADKLRELETNRPDGLSPALLASLPAEGSTSPASPSDAKQPSPVEEDTYPSSIVTFELPLLDDEGLSTLDKIYLFSTSKATFHRIYVCQSLPELLEPVHPAEAVEYVLPLLSGLAMDTDERVKEALASQLVDIIWWFFTNCRPTSDEPWASGTFPTPNSDHPHAARSPSPLHSTAYADDFEESIHDSKPLISVSSFTPILGTLLLSPNTVVGARARFTVVEILRRIQREEDREAGLDEDLQDHEGEVTGTLGKTSRELVSAEIVDQVVIGMARLDGSHTEEDEMEEFFDAVDVHLRTPRTPHNDSLDPNSPLRIVLDNTRNSYNPYFPPIAPSSPNSSSSSSSSNSSSHLSGASSSSSPASIGSLSTTSSAKGSPMEFPIEFSKVTSPLAETDKLSESKAYAISGIVRDNRPRSPGSAPLGSPQSIIPRTVTGSNPVDAPLNNTPSSQGDEIIDEEGDDGEQAAVGRLSSMSLIAAVAASGCLHDDVKSAFVHEVERASSDEIYWVRREASFALGALAKVVPQEIVVSSLLPLFEALCVDQVHHVRHSALFALPGILSRLPLKRRRSLALKTMAILGKDDSPSVRLGALEALGEVIYAFHEDEDGPPEELVQQFLSLPNAKSYVDTGSKKHLFDADEDRSARLLICAFNFPAVALTLGPHRWENDLRSTYLGMAADSASPVRKSLTASLGELAKIIGPARAARDTMGVWWDAARCDQEDVRTKAVECLETYMRALGQDERKVLLQGVLQIWEEGGWKVWRDRETIATLLVEISQLILDGHEAVRKLLMKALEDGVSAVREAGIKSLSRLWPSLRQRPAVLRDLGRDIFTLAKSTVHRRRMTFVACQQALVLPSSSGGAAAMDADDAFWKSIVDSGLAEDETVGVRIGVARLVGSFYDRSRMGDYQISSSPRLSDLALRLSHDGVREVRAYVSTHLDQPKSNNTIPQQGHSLSEAIATFSRPPMHITPVTS